MVSKSQTWTLDAGQTVHLECEFTADQFNLFDNPTVWRKRQHHPDNPIRPSTPSDTSVFIRRSTSSPKTGSTSASSASDQVLFNDPDFADDSDERPSDGVTVATSSVTSFSEEFDEDGGAEESQINMMGNLVEPFASAKRFRATFSRQSTQTLAYLFGLTIASMFF